MASSLANKVKVALRISHTNLDTEIERLISAGKAELVRSGCAADVVNEPTIQMEQAIITYCLANLAASNQREKYDESFRYQQDCLRKSG